MKDFRNLFRIGLLSFLIGGCCSTTADVPVKVGDIDEFSEDVTLRRISVERLRRATVAIINDDGLIKLPMCAGVWIGKDLLLTAAHCVDDKLVVKYASIDDYRDEKTHSATLVGVDEKLDLALLLAPGVSTHPIISFSNDSILPGDPVDIVGHPVGYDWTYSKGYISAARDDMGGPNGKLSKVLQIAAPVWMGSSGGGAFDSDGNLVGICSWVSKNGPHLTFFIHKDVIEPFVIEQLSRINPRP